VTVEPKEKKIEVGQNAAFACNASGNPPPIIVWNHTGKGVQMGNVLHFEEAGLNHVGCYSCSAENEEGTEVASVCLYVIGK